MTDSVFESRLERAAKRYANEAIRPIDAAQIAAASATAGPTPVGQLRRSLSLSRPLYAVALLLMAVLISGTLILVGAWVLDRSDPVPQLPAGATGKLAYSVDGDIYIAGRDGSDRILVADGTYAQDGFYEPRWSPDGRHLAYGGQGQTFFVVDAAGRPVGEGIGFGIAWSPDSSLIASVVGVTTRHKESDPNEASVSISSVDGTLRARLALPGLQLGNIVRSFWTPDGRAVIVSRLRGGGSTGSTWLVPIDGGAPRPFPVEPGYGALEIFSPDGSRVVGVAGDQLVVADADGSNLRPLAAYGASPMWSPRGDRIAFVGDAIAIVDADTGAIETIWELPPQEDPLTSFAAYVTGWSPDGARVLVESHDPRVLGLWSISADGSERQRLVEGSMSGGNWQVLPLP